MDDDITSLQGPVELEDGKLMLSIPLEAGGAQLIDCSRGISRVDEGFLKIEILPWLAEKLGIKEGNLVHVDNRDGKFNIWRISEADEPAENR